MNRPPNVKRCARSLRRPRRPECPRSELRGLWKRYRALVSQAGRRDWLALGLALSLLGNELKGLLDGHGREAGR